MGECDSNDGRPAEEALSPVAEGADQPGGPGGIVALTLFIAGATERSQRAVALVKKLCEERIPGICELEVVDVYQQPDPAREARIVVAPTLIKTRPRPVRRFSGDLMDVDLVLARLGLRQGDR